MSIQLTLAHRSFPSQPLYVRDFVRSHALTYHTCSSNVNEEVYNGMGRHIQALTMNQGIGSLKVSLFVLDGDVDHSKTCRLFSLAL